MGDSARAVLSAVQQRLRDEPEHVLPALRLIADPDALAGDDDDGSVELARTLNVHRIVASLRELRARSYTTAQVAELLGGVTRQAVSLRVASGKLLRQEISGKSYFPQWQFVDGAPARGLAAVIAALLETGHDAFTADGLMREPLGEQGGRSPADLLADGDVELAVHYIRASGF